MVGDDDQVYEFKGFRLEAAQRRLLHNGQAVPLKPKILDLLLLLVQMRGRLVEKDELMKEIWPNTIVEENNITVSMSILRKTLGEDRAGRQFIETVPGRGYRFVADVKIILPEQANAQESPKAAAASAVELEPRETPIDSLAVLPLRNISKDPNSEYLSEGITESIINTLSRISKLRVLAPSTVFRFKGKDVDPQEIGQLLKVRAVMLGRVMQLGEKLVIRSELVNVADGSLIWGEQYDRTLSDLLSTQDEIARAITESLKLKLTRQDQIRLSKRYTANTEAYNLYLRGRYFWNRYDKEWVLKSIEAFEQAIRIDASYALAYTGIADAYFRLSNLHASPLEVLPKAKEAALKAVEIDNDLAEAHSSLGLLRVYYDHDWTAAEREFTRALELNPDLTLAHQRYGTYLKLMGRFDESFAHYKQALELDPFSLQININLATIHYLKGDTDVAITHLKKTLELEPNYMPTHFVLGNAYIQQGNWADAIAEFELIYRRDDEAYLALGFLGYCHAMAGRRAEAESLRNILQDVSRRKYVSPYGIIIICVALGQIDQAMELFEQLYAERNDWLVWLKVSPKLKHLHSDPRFRDLLRRIGFPD
ncbi:MAG TPA: winged helix-turn-helix domain-containing protein [Pyrinomonadaceae bacterium]|nr:winged helix-turn-helix domain-containing protein [Pyrinomonadaceae bacterium]